MKKMKLTRSLLAACSIVALTAVMYGCVHGGGDDEPATDTTEAPPTPEELLAEAEAEIERLEGELADAQGDLSDAQEELSDTEDDLETARGEVTRISGALSDANDNVMQITSELTAARTHASDLADRLAASTGDNASLQTMLDAANADVMRLMGELTTAQGNVTRLMGELADANGEVTRLEGEVTRLEGELGDANDEIARLVALLPPEVDPYPARTAAAGTKAKAIAAEQAQTPDANLGGSARSDTDGTTTSTDATDDPYTLTISNDGTLMVGISVPGAAMTDPAFEDQMAGLSDGRTMLTRTQEADMDGNVVTEVAIVGTDIDPPTAVPFAEFEFHTVSGSTIAVTMPQALNARLDGITTFTDANPADTRDLGGILASTDTAQAAVLELVMSPAFVAPTDPTETMLEFAFDDTTTADTDEAYETAGTYNGAPGTYRCNGTANCTVTFNDDSGISGMSDGWVFTPDEGATSDQPDYAYLSYGFWLQRTTDADGAVTYDEVETFAMAHGLPETDDGNTADGGIGSVMGTASYSGSSVGVYVKNVLDQQANIVTATSGHFMADVALNATFGGNSVPANDHFTISGTVTGFELSGGEENDWAVTLGLTDFSGRTTGNEPGMSEPGTIHVNEFSGVATGDATAPAGSWSGTFWGLAGSAVDHDGDGSETTPTPAINQAPAAVTGEFNAHFTDGVAAGGYGANIDDE